MQGARGIQLLIPFLLGFSTSLVMSILNRMIKGVETTFGIESGAAARPAGREDASAARNLVHPEHHAPEGKKTGSGEITKLDMAQGRSTVA
jgi:hypothetical protein